MNSDDTRYSQYFTTRAATIELPPGDPSSVPARAVARRRRRRSVGTGLVALALVAGSLGMQQIDGGSDDGSEVAAQANAVTAAEPLQWSTVVPNVGLAYATSMASTDDGITFGLSTAPGRYDPDTAGDPNTLYRSSDGVEWSTVALPADLWPSQLAAAGRNLYAVGTSPAAGGGRSLVLASSAAGDGWTTAALPLDLAALDARYGDALAVTGMDVAATPTGVVAAVQIQSTPDLRPLLPADQPMGGWAWTDTGVDIYGAPEGCTLVGLDDIQCDDEGGRVKPEAPPVIASYTFEQLGIDAAQQSLIRGELHVFASNDDGAFEEVAVPDGVAGIPTVLASGDTFVVFAQRWNRSHSEVTTLRSDDGRTWTEDAGLALDGYAVASGSLRGAAAIITQPDRSGALLNVVQPGGGWTTLDIGAAIAALAQPAGSMLSVSSGDIGPLGAAAVVSAYDETSSTEQRYAVFSPDGQSITVQPLDQLPNAPAGYPAAVRVSADAVTIVFGDADSGDGVATTTLLVGTPAG
jgi:hypothetical protein